MHILITNHETEIGVFRRALGTAADQLEVVENNLSALSLLGSSPTSARTLTITEYQDEGVNVDTRTFVRNLATRGIETLEIIIVGQLFTDLTDPQIHVVETIEDAAQLICSLDTLQPVAVGAESSEATHTSNGHARFTPETTAVSAAPASSGDTKPGKKLRLSAPIKPAKRYETDGGFERELTPEAQPADTLPPVAAPQPPETNELDEMPATTRSLADDIRDWTERTEQERGKQRTKVYKPGFFERLMLNISPAARRARAEEAELDKLIRAPRLTQCHSIAVISPKGGVGKSFLTYVVGNFLAEVRGDKVVAIDTNPDFGTLADQVRGREAQTVSTLLEQIDSIRHYSDLRRFTSKVESRLEVLAAPADPDVMATIGAADYGRVHQQLHHYYDTILFDCGTGFRDDITRFALQQCDQIVLVSAPLFITTGIVIRALGYLNQIGCDLSRVTLAINQVRREKPLDLNYMRSRFGDRLNAIIEIPFDVQLYREMDTGEFLVERTQPATRTSIKRLVSELVRHFD